MKRTYLGVIAIVALSVLVEWTALLGRAQSSQAPTAGESPRREPSNQEINDAFVQEISRRIHGHEQEPSGKVFKNIQVDFLKKTPAARLLLIMNEGYSKALGVNCKHCHVEDDFSKDDKRPKRCARDMAGMHFLINQQLAKMQNLAPNPNGHFINCSTCHRGAIDPLEHP